MEETLKETNFLEIGPPKRGKVRDIYDLGDKLLIIATDRISAFDVVLPTTIPNKGKILNKLSIFWFKQVEDIVENHLIESEVERFPESLKTYAEFLKDRSMLVKKTKVIPVECIVRGYLAGSGWKDYKESGYVCGIKLPPNLRESEKLPEPIFTPTTKAESGHDTNITEKALIGLIGEELAKKLKELSLKIYKKASDLAEKKGIIIADTKFEFGLLDGKVILIDELLTPDSSRFWSLKDYKVGVSQDSFDKQIVRDYLNTLNWDKTPPAPELPENVVKKTAKRYEEIFNILTQ